MVKYIIHCIMVMGGYNAEIIEVDECDIYDTKEEAEKKLWVACR